MPLQRFIAFRDGTETGPLQLFKHAYTSQSVNTQSQENTILSCPMVVMDAAMQKQPNV